MKETTYQKAILDFLGFKKVFHWRNNNTGIYDPSKGSFRKNKGQLNGVPDIIAIINGRFVGIEVKSPTGKQSIIQQHFEEMCKINGGIYILAVTVDDMLAGLKENDIIL